jgi:hypothetical protein
MRLVCRFALAIASLSIITSISGVVVPLKAAAIDTPLTAGPLNAPGMPKAGQITGNTSLEQVLLSRARANSADLASGLANFVCRERMERFRAAHGESVGKPIDIITSNVSFENGRERYTEILQNNKERKSIASISGAWSEGEYATFLNETRKVLDSEVLKLQSVTSLNGEPAGLFSFEFDQANSPWDLQIGSKHYPVGFLFEMWVSLKSGDIIRISRSSTSMSPQTQIAEVDWLVDFGAFDVDGKTFMLPKDGVYSVTYLTSPKHEWNVLTFSDYHRFSSEVAIHFQ